MEKFYSKVLLFGEYSLLYNSMAITLPYKHFGGKFAFMDATSGEEERFSHKCINDFYTYLVENKDVFIQLDLQRLKEDLDKGLYFESNIPRGSGLGSSGALVAGMYKVYSKVEISASSINTISEHTNDLRSILSKMESYFHGSSSGIDPLSILLGKPLLFKNMNDISFAEVPAYNAEGKNTVFLLNTNIERNTDELVAKFKAIHANEKVKQEMETQLIATTNECIRAFMQNDPETLYVQLEQLIRYQLKNMHCLIPDTYQPHFLNGIQTHDYYLKICGAGGGGFMLGFTQNWDKTKEALGKFPLDIIYRF